MVHFLMRIFLNGAGSSPKRCSSY